MAHSHIGKTLIKVTAPQPLTPAKVHALYAFFQGVALKTQTLRQKAMLLVSVDFNPGQRNRNGYCDGAWGLDDKKGLRLSRLLEISDRN